MPEKLKNLHFKEDDKGNLYAEVKVTSVNCCQSCGKKFDDIELVFYAPIDNTIICGNCTHPHGEIEARLYIKD